MKDQGRRSARSAAGRLGGFWAARLTGQLQAAQIEYAMVRSRTDSPADPALEAQRQRIRAIRAALATGPVPRASYAAAPAALWSPQPLPQTLFVVPAGGMPVWPAPVPGVPAGRLPEGLQVAVLARLGAWAQVRGAAGWTGWVDGRLLIEHRTV